MSVAKDMMDEMFGEYTKDEFGNEVFGFPHDFEMCHYCGYVGKGWINYVCPKCKKVSKIHEMYLRDKKERSNTERSNHADGIIKSLVTEFWVATKYRNQDFKVAKTSKYDYILDITIPDEDSIKRLLEGYDKKAEVLEHLKSMYVGLPDLILLKEGKISFVEVKSSSSIRENQFNTMKYLQSKGYEVFVEEVDFTYQVNGSKIIQLSEFNEKTNWKGEVYYKKDSK